MGATFQTYYTMDGMKIPQFLSIDGDNHHYEYTIYGEPVDATTYYTAMWDALPEPFDFSPTDPQHECETIQRMSEAYRANVI